MADPTASTGPEPPQQDDAEEIKGMELLRACQAGDLQRVQALLAEGAPAYYQVRASHTQLAIPNFTQPNPHI